MSLLEEGMIFAVRNFKSKKNSDGNKSSSQQDEEDATYIERFTLLVASRIWPDHYGLRAPFRSYLLSYAV